jgi:hypothetical protein
MHACMHACMTHASIVLCCDRQRRRSGYDKRMKHACGMRNQLAITLSVRSHLLKAEAVCSAFGTWSGNREYAWPAGQTVSLDELSLWLVQRCAPHQRGVPPPSEHFPQYSQDPESTGDCGWLPPRPANVNATQLRCQYPSAAAACLCCVINLTGTAMAVDRVQASSLFKAVRGPWNTRSSLAEGGGSLTEMGSLRGEIGA